MRKARFHILITGSGVSGKVTLANYFKSKGRNVIAVDLAGVGHWLNENGNEANFSIDTDTSEIDKWAEGSGVSWHWKHNALTELLSRFKQVCRSISWEVLKRFRAFRII